VIAMVDPNKDKTHSKAGSGQRADDPSMTGSGSQNTSGSRADSSSSQQGAQSKASQMAGEAKQQAKSMASQAAEQGKSAINQQKDNVVQKVDTVSDAIRSAADELQEGGQPQTGHYVSMVADQLESFSRQLRNKDANSLLRDAESLARRSPVVFFAGALLAGFAASRFMRSSAQHLHSDYEGGYGASQMRGDEEDSSYSWRNEMGEGDHDINIGRNRTQPLDTEAGGLMADSAASGTLGGQWGAGTNVAGPEITGIYRPSEAQGGSTRPSESRASAQGVELPGSAQPSVSADGKPQQGRPTDAIGGSVKSTSPTEPKSGGNIYGNR
jgi:gas vesicle protein